ncbi:MAG: hypothetical protein ACRDJL_03460, partial [Actinomycetota bacterium]
MEDPAVTRWRAELEARRRAGIPDYEVLQQEGARRGRRPRRFRSRWLVLVALVALGALPGWNVIPGGERSELYPEPLTTPQ